MLNSRVVTKEGEENKIWVRIKVRIWRRVCRVYESVNWGFKEIFDYLRELDNCN